MSIKKIFIISILLSIGISLERKSVSNFKVLNNTLTFEVAPKDVIYKDGYLKLLEENQESTQDIGFPELPTYSTLYMVSPDKDYNFEIIVHDSYLVEDVDIFPYQGTNRASTENNLVINDSFYNSSQIYPEQNIIFSERMNARHMELILLSVIPYSYNAASKELEVYTNVEIFINVRRGQR